jgi:hypothetical protein
MESRYRAGTIVHARGREWIVLPPREPEVLRLRPLTTAHGEEVGLFLPLEGERWGWRISPIPNLPPAAMQPA